MIKIFLSVILISMFGCDSIQTKPEALKDFLLKCKNSCDSVNRDFYYDTGVFGEAYCNCVKK